MDDIRQRNVWVTRVDVALKLVKCLLYSEFGMIKACPLMCCDRLRQLRLLCASALTSDGETMWRTFFIMRSVKAAHWFVRICL